MRDGAGDIGGYIRGGDASIGANAVPSSANAVPNNTSNGADPNDDVYHGASVRQHEMHDHDDV